LLVKQKHKWRGWFRALVAVQSLLELKLIHFPQLLHLIICPSAPLESQVAQLQAQIALAKSRIAALGEADIVANGALQALQDAVAKISGLAPSAIATLKAAALNLFHGGDNQRTIPKPN